MKAKRGQDNGELAGCVFVLVMGFVIGIFVMDTKRGWDIDRLNKDHSESMRKLKEEQEALQPHQYKNEVTDKVEPGLYRWRGDIYSIKKVSVVTIVNPEGK